MSVEVDAVAVGDRVLAFTDFGGYAEYAVARSPVRRAFSLNITYTSMSGLMLC